MSQAFPVAAYHQLHLSLDQELQITEKYTLALAAVDDFLDSAGVATALDELAATPGGVAALAHLLLQINPEKPLPSSDV
ncbi:hypothetical protein M1116_01780 [Patescibacteria group bacterium]|nr:hypothetical protein [Patescibacteria group bacterium]